MRIESVNSSHATETVGAATTAAEPATTTTTTCCSIYMACYLAPLPSESRSSVQRTERGEEGCSEAFLGARKRVISVYAGHAAVGLWSPSQEIGTNCHHLALVAVRAHPLSLSPSSAILYLCVPLNGN